MREIKFRAWGNRDNCWCGAFSVHKSGLFTEMSGAKMENGVCIAYADWIDLSKQDEIVLMQYTGLKDKNGKEIYLGDILQTSNLTDHSIDIWDKNVHGLTICQELDDRLGFTFSNWHPKYDEDSVYDFRYIEVIGNIYENPELLK